VPRFVILGPFSIVEVLLRRDGLWTFLYIPRVYSISDARASEYTGRAVFAVDR
jgi:hypothetical protein